MIMVYRLKVSHYQEVAMLVLKIDSTLELRQLLISDSIDIFNTIDSQREYLGRWLPFVAHTRVLADTEKFVKAAVDASQDSFEYIFTIRKDGHFMGLIGFKNTDGLNKKTEIGYWLAFEFQKRGIMTASVRKLCQFAFETQKLNRIQIKCAVDNIRSINIPKRLGFQFEGIERQGELLTGGVYTDLVVYSQLASEWKNA